MKKTILLSAFLLFSLCSFSQSVKNDAELGNSSLYAAYCWSISGLAISNESSTRIDGKYSFRTTNLDKESLSTAYLKSPWIKLQKGNISFKAKLDGAEGGQRSIVVQYIETNFKWFEGISKIFYTYNFTQPLHKNTKVQNISIPVPAELVNGKNYKIQISFIGVGGSAKVAIDNLQIPGEYHSDPSFFCLPLSIEQDADGDGVVDAEDEFPDDPNRAYSTYFPGKDYGTLMFEDLWPGIGDYDFNDLVVDYQIKKITDAKNEIVEMIVNLRTRAIGAGFKNGLGIEFTNIAPDRILSVSGAKISGKTIHKFAANGLEEGTKWMTFIPFDNAFNILPHPGGGVTGVNTDPKGPKQEIIDQTIIITFKKNGKSALGGPVKTTEISLENFNPFLIRNQDRSIEIHLPGKPPTSLADQKLFGTIDDDSNPGKEKYYQSKGTNLPWALHINQNTPYMIEKYNIIKGFIKFEEWVISNGKAYPDWYMDQPGYREKTAIY